MGDHKRGLKGSLNARGNPMKELWPPSEKKRSPKMRGQKRILKLYHRVTGLVGWLGHFKRIEKSRITPRECWMAAMDGPEAE